MSTLEQDVRTLQSQVRRQRRWNIALGALVVVGGLMAATGVRSVPDVIQAKKFEVVNDEGKVLVLMDSVFSKGERYGFVTTQNGKGQKLVAIGASADGGIVTTQNGKGQTLVAIGVTTDGEGRVTTENGKGQTLVALGASAVGGAVKTQNGKGQTLVELGASADGGIVTTQNDQGVTLVRLTTDQSGNGAVLAQDAAGNIKATLP